MIARFMALFSSPMASDVEFSRRHDRSFVAQTAAQVHQGVIFSGSASSDKSRAMRTEPAGNSASGQKLQAFAARTT
jgi:hypothetical protein